MSGANHTERQFNGEYFQFVCSLLIWWQRQNHSRWRLGKKKYLETFNRISHVTCFCRVQVAFIRKNIILKWILQISGPLLSSLIKDVLKCIWTCVNVCTERGKQRYCVSYDCYLEFLAIRVVWRHHQSFKDLVDKQLFWATKNDHQNQINNSTVPWC